MHGGMSAELVALDTHLTQTHAQKQELLTSKTSLV